MTDTISIVKNTTTSEHNINMLESPFRGVNFSLNCIPIKHSTQDLLLFTLQTKNIRIEVEKI